MTPVYEFSIPQRAALQLLTHAMEHLGSATVGLSTQQERQANRHAAQILWQCRELVLCAAERQPQGGAQ